VSIQPAFFGLDIDDRRLYPLYARAEELGLVVAIHTGLTYSRMHPLKHERPELLDQVACDFAELRLVPPGVDLVRDEQVRHEAACLGRSI
jgi:predicted TIM-barrel fold metal-dependent hydrolase